MIFQFTLYTADVDTDMILQLLNRSSSFNSLLQKQESDK